jgi:hypothetical protein
LKAFTKLIFLAGNVRGTTSVGGSNFDKRLAEHDATDLPDEPVKEFTATVGL